MYTYGKGITCNEFWWGNQRERGYWGDPGEDERIILRLIFRMWDMGLWTGLVGTG
jgi:hypothetical protein